MILASLGFLDSLGVLRAYVAADPGRAERLALAALVLLAKAGAVIALAALAGYAGSRLASRFKRFGRAAGAVALAAAFGAVWLYFDAGLQRLIVMRWGTACDALIEGKGARESRSEQYWFYRYVEVNFAYAPGRAATTDIEVNPAALEKLNVGDKVKIHYRPPLHPVLDEDFGAGREIALSNLIPLILILVWAAGIAALDASRPPPTPEQIEERRRELSASNLRWAVARLAVITAPLLATIARWIVRRLGL